jgi:hypothetical protein
MVLYHVMLAPVSPHTGHPGYYYEMYSIGVCAEFIFKARIIVQ